MRAFLLVLLAVASAHAERAVTEGKTSTATSITVSSLAAHVAMGGDLAVVSSGTFGSGVTASSFTALGTPGFKGDATNLTGTATALNIGGTAATVTTNANLTGDVTSVGNAATAAATQANIATLSKTGGVTITNGATAPTGTFTANMSCSSCTVYGPGGLLVYSSATFGNPTGAAPPPSIVFYSSGTNGGSLLNPMTAAQMNTLPIGTLSSGTVVFNITSDQYNYWNGAVWAAMGGGGGIISTGPASGNGTWQAPQRSTMVFDSAFVQATDSPTINATFITFKNMGGITSAPTWTEYLTASTVAYTVKTGVSMLIFDFPAGGGGGGGSIGGSAGTVGGASSLAAVGVSSITANPGIGGGVGAAGGCGPAAGGTGGVGGTGQVASNIYVQRWSGGSGGPCSEGSYSNTGWGGNGRDGGGGSPGNSVGPTAATAGAANTGAGGGGGAIAANDGGAGGSAAETVRVIFTAPFPASFQLTVGNGGAAGSGGPPGAGGTGGMRITEYYGTQGFAAPASSFTTIPQGSYTTTQTTFAQAVTGSTVTITTSGAPVYVTASGTSDCSGVACIAGFSFLVDGGYATGFGPSTSAFIANDAANVNSQGGFSFTRRVDGLSVGSHSFALTATTSAGTLRIGGNNVAPTGNAQFGVYEMKNTAGTGDISSNGPNTLSNTNNVTASGSLTVMGASNFAVLVSSYDYASNVSTITISTADFSGVDFSSAAWRIHLSLTSGSAIHYMLYFDSDFGAPGSWTYRTNNLQSGGGVSGAALINKGCVLDDTAGGIQVGASAAFITDFRFETTIGSNGTVLGTSDARFSSNSTPTIPAHAITDCYRSGSTGVPTKISISFNTTADSTAVPNTSGTARGHVELWREGPRHP